MLTVLNATRVLCYGDSNTWGQLPETRRRYTNAERWTARLQTYLGSNFDILEEGLSGRTTDVDCANRPGRNGKQYLLPCLQTHNPLSGVVLMLGTNDCKIEFDRSAADIATAIRGLVADVRAFARDEQGNAPKILLVSPAPINPNAAHFKELYTTSMNKQSVKVSEELPAELAKVASLAGCAFFDAGTVAKTGVDGVHLTVGSHDKLATAIAGIVKEWA